MSATERLVAILKSSDVTRTEEWYTAAGFEVRGSHPDETPTWCEVARDGTVLQFLAGETPWEGGPSLTGCLYVPTDNVDAVYNEIRDKVTCEWGIEERESGSARIGASRSGRVLHHLQAVDNCAEETPSPIPGSGFVDGPLVDLMRCRAGGHSHRFGPRRGRTGVPGRNQPT